MDSTEAGLKEARHGSIGVIRTTETSGESEDTCVMLTNREHATDDRVQPSRPWDHLSHTRASLGVYHELERISRHWSRTRQDKSRKTRFIRGTRRTNMGRQVMPPATKRGRRGVSVVGTSESQ